MQSQKFNWNLVLMAFCLFSGRAAAQSGVGLVAGLNAGSQTSNIHFTDRALIGPAVSAFYETQLKSHFSIDAKLGYIQKGNAIVAEFTDEQGSGIGSGSFQERYHYVEAAILGKWNFNHNKWQPFVTLGPSVGYFLGGQYKTKAPNEFPNIKQSFTAEDVQINPLDISVAGGLGIGCKTQKGRAFFQVEYLQSLANISKIANGTLYNHNFTCSIGYIHHLESATTAQN